MGFTTKTLLHVIITLSYFLAISSTCSHGQGLQYHYYEKTCPSVEKIVTRQLSIILSKAPSLAGPLLRMHFHDCFVRGCDASVLINSTSTNHTEKEAFPNLSLRGFGSIDRIKTAIENECPGVVSCADILALVARDTVTMTRGPYYEVPLGRRDGTVSNVSEANSNLPPPFFNFTQLLSAFASKGLNAKDLVVLSGGHTIGTSHCSSFTNRLYNFTGKGDMDPALDSNYATRLKIRCSPTDLTTLVEMDPGSFLTFDLDYYKQVTKRRGLFTSDATFLDDAEAKKYITTQLSGKGSTFFDDFAVSMVKMGKIEVLTGNKGEIRKRCAFVN